MTLASVTQTEHLVTTFHPELLLSGSKCLPFFIQTDGRVVIGRRRRVLSRVSVQSGTFLPKSWDGGSQYFCRSSVDARNNRCAFTSLRITRAVHLHRHFHLLTFYHPYLTNLETESIIRSEQSSTPLRNYTSPPQSPSTSPHRTPYASN
jgi:hypothetical protein